MFGQFTQGFDAPFECVDFFVFLFESFGVVGVRFFHRLDLLHGIRQFGGLLGQQAVHDGSLCRYGRCSRFSLVVVFAFILEVIG